MFIHEGIELKSLKLLITSGIALKNIDTY
jgi:hypothetical protein